MLHSKYSFQILGKYKSKSVKNFLTLLCLRLCWFTTPATTEKDIDKIVGAFFVTRK